MTLSEIVGISFLVVFVICFVLYLIEFFHSWKKRF